MIEIAKVRIQVIVRHFAFLLIIKLVDLCHTCVCPLNIKLESNYFSNTCYILFAFIHQQREKQSDKLLFYEDLCAVNISKFHGVAGFQSLC